MPIVIINVQTDSSYVIDQGALTRDFFSCRLVELYFGQLMNFWYILYIEEMRKCTFYNASKCLILNLCLYYCLL